MHIHIVQTIKLENNGSLLYLHQILGRVLVKLIDHSCMSSNGFLLLYPSCQWQDDNIGLELNQGGKVIKILPKISFGIIKIAQ